MSQNKRNEMKRQENLFIFIIVLFGLRQLISCQAKPKCKLQWKPTETTTEQLTAEMCPQLPLIGMHIHCSKAIKQTSSMKSLRISFNRILFVLVKGCVRTRICLINISLISSSTFYGIYMKCCM